MGSFACSAAHILADCRCKTPASDASFPTRNLNFSMYPHYMFERHTVATVAHGAYICLQKPWNFATPSSSCR